MIRKCLFTILLTIFLIYPILAVPTADFTISYYNTSISSFQTLTSMNITKGQIIAVNASVGGGSSWDWNYGDGYTGTGLNTTHVYTFGRGVTLMLHNGWTQVSITLLVTDALGDTASLTKTINLTTPMEDIIFVGPAVTIAPLNTSFANTFIAVIGGNTSVSAAWTGIDWLAGLAGVQDVYVSVLGLSLFYILIFAMPFIMQWIISKDFVVAGIIGGFLGIWIVVRLPASMRILAVTFIGMSIVAIIYSLVKERI